LSLFLVSCSVWPPSLLEAAFFFCYSSTALAGGYSCVTLTLTLSGIAAEWAEGRAFWLFERWCLLCCKAAECGWCRWFHAEWHGDAAIQSVGDGDAVRLQSVGDVDDAIHTRLWRMESKETCGSKGAALPSSTSVALIHSHLGNNFTWHDDCLRLNVWAVISTHVELSCEPAVSIIFVTLHALQGFLHLHCNQGSRCWPIQSGGFFWEQQGTMVNGCWQVQKVVINCSNLWISNV